MILYIDTCYKVLNIALYENSKILSSYIVKLENNMTDLTLRYVQKIFEDAKKDISLLSKVIAVNGPGSFTGIRIGLTIAKTIAFSLNIPIITISKLTTMAISSDKEYKVPIISARRSFIFASIFRNNQIIFKEAYINQEELNNKLKEINNYVYITYDDLSSQNKETAKVNFEKVINYALNLKSTPVELVDANYLKKTEAEERNNK
jgi:universal bacterial protein yeaZ